MFVIKANTACPRQKAITSLTHKERATKTLDYVENEITHQILFHCNIHCMTSSHIFTVTAFAPAVSFDVQTKAQHFSNKIHLSAPPFSEE